MLSRENGGCIFIIDSKSSIKEVIQLAIRQNHESYIFCVRDSQINLVSEIDQLLEGVAIAYNGQIIKSSDEFVSYKVIPSPSEGGEGGTDKVFLTQFSNRIKFHSSDHSTISSYRSYLQTNEVYALGIDLGTTNSVASYAENNNPVVIPDKKGNYLTPSIVNLGPDNFYTVGSL